MDFNLINGLRFFSQFSQANLQGHGFKCDNMNDFQTESTVYPLSN